MDNSYLLHMRVLECEDQIEACIDYLELWRGDLEEGKLSGEKMETAKETYRMVAFMLRDHQNEYRRLTGELPARFTIPVWEGE